MNIVMHDYADHPFQVELSRELARHGHRVTHRYCTFCATDKAAVVRNTADPDGFSVESLSMSATRGLGGQIISGSSTPPFPDCRTTMSLSTRSSTKTFDKNGPERYQAAISTARTAVLNWEIARNSTAFVPTLDPLSPSRLAWLCRRGSSANHLGGKGWPR
jgi:hypothetical protein